MYLHVPATLSLSARVKSAAASGLWTTLARAFHPLAAPACAAFAKASTDAKASAVVETMADRMVGQDGAPSPPFVWPCAVAEATAEAWRRRVILVSPAPFPCKMSKNRRVSAAQFPYYHVLRGLQQKTSKNFIFCPSAVFPPSPCMAELSPKTAAFEGRHLQALNRR